jgi:hypothetical protein
VLAILFDPNTWQPFMRDRAVGPGIEGGFPVYVTDLGGGRVRSKIPAGIQGAVKLEEITSAPWLSIRQGLTPFPLSEKPFPCSGEKLPFYLIIDENTLFLAKPAGTPRFIIDTALTGTQESNHFFGHWEGGEPAQSAAAPSYRGKGRVEEVRIFGRSASVIEEQLKQVAKTLNPPFSGRTLEVGGGDGKQIADSYPG